MPLLSISLPPQAEGCDEASVALHVLTAQVVEEPAALADHHQQAAPAVVVVLVLPQVLGEVVDPLGQDGHLDLGGSGVSIVLAVFGDDLFGGLHPGSLCARVKPDGGRGSRAEV